MIRSPGRISRRPSSHSSAIVRVSGTVPGGFLLIPLVSAVAGAIVGARMSSAFPLAGGMVGFLVGLAGGGIAVQIAEGPVAA